MAKSKDNNPQSDKSNDNLKRDIGRINESLKAQQDKAGQINKGMTSGKRPKPKK